MTADEAKKIVKAKYPTMRITHVLVCGERGVCLGTPDQLPWLWHKDEDSAWLVAAQSILDAENKKEKA